MKSPLPSAANESFLWLLAASRQKRLIPQRNSRKQPSIEERIRRQRHAQRAAADPSFLKK